MPIFPADETLMGPDSSSNDVSRNSLSLAVYHHSVVPDHLSRTASLRVKLVPSRELNYNCLDVKVKKINQKYISVTMPRGCG